MTREEAIETIKTAIAEVEWEYPMNYAAAFEVAIKALKEQARWISVSERLPEEGVDVLACFYTGERNYKMMVSRRSDYNYWNGVGRTSDMVAWQPLPQPYKAESEEEE